MKRTIIYFVVFVLLITVVPKFLAARGEIEMLTASEQSTLDAELERISEKYDFRVAVETIDRPQNGTMWQTADAIYLEHYGSQDGVMLLIATETRDWDISVHGMGQGYFFAAAREYIGDRILKDLSAGDLNDAYLLYAELCDDFLEKATAGTPYTHDNLPPKPLSTTALLIAVGAGVVIALLIVLNMKSKLTSVAPKASAADYVRSGSLRVNKSEDTFLYRNVTKVTRSNNRGGRSGGSRSSGRHTGGKF